MAFSSLGLPRDVFSKSKNEFKFQILNLSYSPISYSLTFSLTLILSSRYLPFTYASFRWYEEQSKLLISHGIRKTEAHENGPIILQEIR
ncbi:hypothetical protein L6452_42925 [Arctium lappa]|uniref:Uncharacterized protein n=1 Tax=Arctium lappa TaxID=4217 RepID=A0ACB8XJZ4_ARCLA|nr:hypothetical protein L6452_42925 [Arctium lappa]